MNVNELAWKDIFVENLFLSLNIKVKTTINPIKSATEFITKFYYYFSIYFYQSHLLSGFKPLNIAVMWHS
jgi:hypothetical protein